MANTPKEKQSLKACFLKTDPIDELLDQLEGVCQQLNPFALYIATKEKDDCTWIFDSDYILSAIGGTESYFSIYHDFLPELSEEESAVLFFILKKVGPHNVLLVSIETLKEIISELRKDPSGS